MADFDSSGIADGNNLDVGTVITTLDGMAALVTTDGGVVDTSSSSTWVTNSTVTVTVAADEVLWVYGDIYFSVTDGYSTTGRFRFTANGSQLGNDRVFSNGISSLAGNVDTRSMVRVATGLSGIVTVNLDFSRNTGSGSIKVSDSQLNVKVEKYRSS